MPYLAPGVYIEENGFLPRSIQRAPTSAAVFIGPTLKGPIGGHAGSASPLTSYPDFERTYGRPADAGLSPGTVSALQAFALSVRAFFGEGGSRLYVSRVPGQDPSTAEYVQALAATEAIEDIAIVAAPGSTALASGPGRVNRPLEIARVLLAHVARPGAHRFAVLDTPPGLTVAQALSWRHQLNAVHAALYYPWVSSPGGSGDVWLPPSGSVCGIYARVDARRGVHRAPANEVVTGALRLEVNLDATQLEQLNPAGVNGLRQVPARGIRVWGARTISSDPEWRYVSSRRLMTCIEASIQRSLRWVAFEPNSERLWTEVQLSIETFLTQEWRAGALVGERPEQALFVRCGLGSMTQDDLDQGRLVCDMGVALTRPSEFSIQRFVIRTASATGGRV
ncbi:phage tail sheath subtilisin-like domain-containing protein [Hydrogenophaga sp.]|uniref:phage tail sheath family protein n=1 Tax=Hydrogenophaga sp. TaxID=1904254 RepID=UPI0025B8124A|nr:phage tail sheath subtilisin-like domain-containing protein [Hydrogenophaga sp.]